MLSQLQTTSNLEPNWAYASCQGAAGSTYCQFLNGDGDAVTLRLDNQLLGKPHAITEVKLDRDRRTRTTPSSTSRRSSRRGVTPTRSGWQPWPTRQRSSTSPTTRRRGPIRLCQLLSGCAASVRVYNTDGLNYTLSVSVPTLGSKHAITGHSATPATCG